MTDHLGRIASLEGELEALRAENAGLRAQLKPLCELKDAARKYLLGSGETVVEAGRELHRLFKDERAEAVPDAARA
jgi:hypothetical protein